MRLEVLPIWSLLKAEQELPFSRICPDTMLKSLHDFSHSTIVPSGRAQSQSSTRFAPL